MIQRLLAHNAERWLSNHLNAYLRDDDEYRAITRETIIRGLAGIITYAPAASRHPPAARDALHRPRPGTAADEINATAPASPATPAASPIRSPRTAFNRD